MRRSDPNRRSRNGTTLIEVMAAAAMSVMLLGALTLAMRTMNRHETVMLTHDRASSAWQRSLQATIEWDITNSRQWNHRFHALRMTGFTGKDATGHPVLSSREVTYRFVKAGSDVWFIRESAPTDSQSDTPPERSVLCRGVAKILIGRPEDDLASLLAPRGEFETFFPIPSRIRCVLTDSKNQPVLDFMVLQNGGGT